MPDDNDIGHEHFVADVATNRLINWILGVGSCITAGLLLWIGAQTFQLAKSAEVTAVRLEQINETLEQNGRDIRENGKAIDALSARVARLEYADSDREQ